MPKPLCQLNLKHGDWVLLEEECFLYPKRFCGTPTPLPATIYLLQDAETGKAEYFTASTLAVLITQEEKNGKLKTSFSPGVDPDSTTAVHIASTTLEEIRKNNNLPIVKDLY